MTAKKHTKFKNVNWLVVTIAVIAIFLVAGLIFGAAYYFYRQANIEPLAQELFSNNNTNSCNCTK